MPVGLAGSVMVATSPLRPVLAVSVVAARRRDDGAAQHFRDGDRDHAHLQADVGVAVQSNGRGKCERAGTGPLQRCQDFQWIS